MEYYTVPSRQGKLISPETSIIHSLSTLEVVWANKFEGENISPETAVKKEAEFYKGAPPQWLNFYWAERERSPFVRRDMYEEKIRTINKNKQRSWSMTCINLFHQPGSGGSTLAMQILWDLRKELRCAKVADSTTDTQAVARQVVQLFNAGGVEDQNTVLLLLDNNEDPGFKKKLQDNLIEEMKVCRITATVPLVIILNCARQLTETKTRALERGLSEREEEAFEEKLSEIIQRHGDRHTQFHAFNIMLKNYSPDYITKTCESLHTIKNEGHRKEQLLACLVLINAYAPGSFLSYDLCRQFLEKDGSALDEFSLEKQMQPFTDLLVIFSNQEGENKSEDKQVGMAHPMITDESLHLMTSAGITRSDTILMLLTDLCRDTMPVYLVKTITKILTKRETRQDMDKTKRRDTFSRLIEDLKEKENKDMCVSVLKTASNTFDQNPFLPQALARFYYIEMTDYEKAEQWAKTAIERDEGNSFIRDTLGQVFINHLKKLVEQDDKVRIGKQAIEAFEGEAEAAINEMKEDGVTKTSTIFNYKGYLGYMQVANIFFDYITKCDTKWSSVLTQEMSPSASFDSYEEYKSFLSGLRGKVESKFEFFEKFLTYSKPSIDKDKKKIWPEVEKCYINYVTQSGQEKTDLQKLKERKVSTFAGLLYALNRPDLEWITGVLKDLYQSLQSDADSLLKYILANILLSHKDSSSKELRPLGELQFILKKHWNEQKDNRSPEFYLLVLLLFWPDGGQVEDDSPDISECIQYMHQSFERTYQCFFHSRYVVPLFFFKEGEGMLRFLRTSEVNINSLYKINSGHESAEIPDLPRVQGEVQDFKVFAIIGSQKIEVSPQTPASVRRHGQVSFYLGFNIKGPVAYNIRYLSLGDTVVCWR